MICSLNFYYFVFSLCLSGLARQLLAFSGLNQAKSEIVNPLEEVQKAKDIAYGSIGNKIRIVLKSTEENDTTNANSTQTK